jgi:hypothetical protein
MMSWMSPSVVLVVLSLLAWVAFAWGVVELHRTWKAQKAFDLDLKDGSVVVLSGQVSYELVNGIRRAIDTSGLRNVLVICLEHGQSITVLKDEDMARHGWVRKRRHDRRT